MNKTKIPWVKNPDGTQGYTWNPITGCLNGCYYCFARKLANGRLRSRYLASSILPCPDEPDHEAHHANPFYPRFWPEKMAQANDFLFSSQYRRYTKPVGVFVCDMSDLFGLGVPEEWTDDVMQLIWDAAGHSSHRFYLLTKKPGNLIKWSPFPDNCYIGVSVTNQKQYDQAIECLQDVVATVKFLSVEPLLERIIP